MLYLSSKFFEMIVLDDPLSGLTSRSNSIEQFWKEIHCLGVDLGS